MTICPTLELGDPALRQVAQRVADPFDPTLQPLIADLWSTLHEHQRQHGWGHALAAPLIGVPLHVLVVAMNDQEFVLINPRLEKWSRTQAVAYESCIAFPSIWGQVSRPERVVVVAFDKHGQEQRYDVDGPLARTIQHEIDHLDGLIWLDRDPDLLTICTTNEYRRRYKPAANDSST